jgi:hypothetical protein
MFDKKPDSANLRKTSNGTKSFAQVDSTQRAAAKQASSQSLNQVVYRPSFDIPTMPFRRAQLVDHGGLDATIATDLLRAAGEEIEEGFFSSHDDNRCIDSLLGLLELTQI